MRKQLSKDTRGNMAAGWGSIVVGMMIVIFSVAAVLIGLDAFKDSVPNTSNAYTAISNGEDFAVNASEQLPTGGTLLGVFFLIAIVGGGIIGGGYAYNRWGPGRG